MIALVMDNLQDSRHGLDRNSLLLGAFHDNVAVSDAVSLHERHKSLWQLLVDEGAFFQSAFAIQIMEYSFTDKGTHMMVLRPSF